MQFFYIKISVRDLLPNRYYRAEKIRSKIDELNKERNEINNLLASTGGPINIKKEIRIWINKIKNNNLELNKKEFIQLLVRKVVVSREEAQIFFNIFARPSNTNAPAHAGTTDKPELKLNRMEDHPRPRGDYLMFS